MFAACCRQCGIYALSAAVLLLVVPLRAERTILADDYAGKLRGMWVGELLGNYAGRPVEGQIARGGLMYTVDWPGARPPAGEPWDGDDDTCFEFLYARMLDPGNPDFVSTDPTPADVGQFWADHMPPSAWYIANRQGRYLIEDGIAPPASGTMGRNMHWYAIDAQITTEALGALAPGLRQRGADLAETFGSVSNSGYSLHAAQFYSAMYSAAAMKTSTTAADVEAVVDSALAVVPATSRSHDVITHARALYQDDRDDGNGLLDWSTSQTSFYDAWYADPAQTHGRYYQWYESSVNLGMTVLALLYGQGDFQQTVEYGVLGGFDGDCNPATAGGVIGLMSGYDGLPTALTDGLPTEYEASRERPYWLEEIDRLATMDEVVAMFQSAAEAQILLAGGSITGSGSERTYHLPDADLLMPPVLLEDPAGPAGLVGAVRALGGTVTPHASVEFLPDGTDAHDLAGIADGIVDVTHNGRRAYSTRDASATQPAGGDWYELAFDAPVRFEGLTFSEGDFVWGGGQALNMPPSYDPAGGYFTTLTVEIYRDGQWVAVDGLTLSEALDPYTFYQQIDLDFDAVVSDRIRIRGSAGGSEEFTSILELTAWGQPGGDVDADGDIDAEDLATLGLHWSPGGSGMAWTDGDFDADGDVDAADLARLGMHWSPAGVAVPEPATLGLLLLAGACLTRRHRSVG